MNRCLMTTAGVGAALYGQLAFAGLVEGNNEFAVKMYRELGAGEGNLFFSPYSISSALGMTYAGAQGETAKEMQAALCFPGGPQELGQAFGKLQDGLDEIRKRGDVSLSIANGIWAEKTYGFLPEFMKGIETGYKARIALADFVNNAAGESKQINAWVEGTTNEKIKNLVPEGVLDAQTRMVLVNAIYFKGDWASQFKENATLEQDFHVGTGKTVKVKMMQQSDGFRLAQDADTQALELPYRGDQLSMLVLLPKAKDGLAALEGNLSVAKIDALVGKLRKTEVDVALPKFKLETSYGLVSPFQNLGMKTAFGSNADFSGMDGSRELYISAILHKAFIEVDEKGTEAAAATAVIMRTTAMVRQEQFIADHPFILLIRDNATGSILFMGRFADPGGATAE